MEVNRMVDRFCLIVDNEPAIRTYLSVVVQCRGIQSIEAENAVEALRILRKPGAQIGLLITAIEMPGDMDGLDLAYSARNSFPNLPVILVSGRIDKAPPGFTGVRKPFKPDAVLKALDIAVPPPK
jgi:CheY-like chemotaxis protein